MIKKAIMVAGCAGLALSGFGADLLPTVQVHDSERSITVSGERVTLDAAYCFDAWPDGVRPPDAEQQELQWGAYADWDADFVITFDRPVPAGSVVVYGRTDLFGSEWVPLPIDSALAANEPYCILKDGLLKDDEETRVPYVAIAEYVVRFMCGVQSTSSSNAGTTMTLELQLCDPVSSAKRTLAKRTCTFRAAKTPNWFDARNAEYRDWPVDAIKAVGGAWNPFYIDVLASVPEPGSLEVEATGIPLAFDAAEAKVLGETAASVTVVSTLDFEEYEKENLPAVDPAWKGGVLVVHEEGASCYYGLVGTADRNVWTRLEGPNAVADGRTACLTMTFAEKDGRRIIGYNIDGVDYLFNGSAEIPIVAKQTVSRVLFRGCGMVQMLSASAQKAKRRCVMVLR